MVRSYLILILNFFAACLVYFTFVQSAHAAAWLDTNQWNDAWEVKYSNWVRAQKETIYVSLDSPYYGIETDCDKNLRTFRAIFSFENKLPFIVTTGFKHVNGVEKPVYISNRSWSPKEDSTSQLDSKQRFIAFINHVNSITDLETLSNDTYPVAIDRNNVVPGAVFVFGREHSFIIHDISPAGVVEFYSSTTPKAVRKLDVRTDIGEPPSGTVADPFDGIRKWRHHDLYPSATSEKGYSSEQFGFAKSPKEAWGDEVQKRLSFVLDSQGNVLMEAPLEKIQRYTDNICDAINQRVGVVTDALKYSRSINFRPMNSIEYYNYSTDNRDDSIAFRYQKLNNYLDQWGNDSSSQEGFVQQAETNLCQCKVNIDPDDPDKKSYVDAYSVESAFLNKKVSANPNLKFWQRWPDSPGADICEQLNSMQTAQAN